MNIFGVGLPEIILIFMIMLIVAGPRRMIQWAYVLGIYIGKARHMWADVVKLMQREFDDAGVDVKLPTELPTRQTINTWVQDATRPYTNPIQETLSDTRNTLNPNLTSAKVAKPAQAANPATVPGDAPNNKPSLQQPDNNKSFGTWGQSSTNKPKPDVERFGTWGVAQEQSQNSRLAADKRQNDNDTSNPPTGTAS